MSSLRNAACELADRGWHVIPLKPHTKIPLTQHGKDDASTNLITVFQWWQRTPEANVAIVCSPSNLLVIDVDPRNGGDDALANGERHLGPLPTTVEVETGGGGWHYYFNHPAGEVKGKLADGLDLKSHGYVLAPPSAHPNGRQYEWSVDGHPDEVQVADLPEPWLQAVSTTARRVTARTESNDPLRNIPGEVYVAALTGRQPDRSGFIQCPFHGGGEERTPSLKVDGPLFACHACPTPPGKRAAGGNILDFAGLLWGFAIPLRGADFMETETRLRKMLL